MYNQHTAPTPESQPLPLRIEWYEPTERLHDARITSKGDIKVTDWRRMKSRGYVISDVLKRIADISHPGHVYNQVSPETMINKGWRMFHCSDELHFNIKTDGSLKLKSAQFCRDRLCPTCTSRTAKIKGFRASEVGNKLLEANPDYIPVFVTMTLRAVPIEDLKETVGTIISGWTRLRNSKKFFRDDEHEKVYIGSIRTVEVNYNPGAQTFNPHLHAVIFVRSDVCEKDGKYWNFHQSAPCCVNDSSTYCKGKKCNAPGSGCGASRMCKKRCSRHCLPRLAQDAFGLDYMPNVDIRKFKPEKDGTCNMSEVAKYITKPMKILGDEDISQVEQDTVLAALCGAIRGRQMHTYGGEARKLYCELYRTDNADDIEDLTDGGIDNNPILESCGTLIYKFAKNQRGEFVSPEEAISTEVAEKMAASVNSPSMSEPCTVSGLSAHAAFRHRLYNELRKAAIARFVYEDVRFYDYWLVGTTFEGDSKILGGFD